MSRVGKNPVGVPQGVEVKVDGQTVTAKGKLGALSYTASADVILKFEDGEVTIAPANDTKKARAMWGTARARIQNLVVGVTKGYKKELEINGVGYRAALQGKNLVLQLGFAHDINFPVPEGIKIECEKPTSIAISGIDKQVVGQVAAEIRGLRGPEPYKGKGIKYVDEHIVRKEGKKK